MKEIKKLKIYRQGDVLLIQVEEIPTQGNILYHKTIARGEATGHHHTFEGDNVIVKELNSNMWVVVENDVAPLTHQEHETILVAPGIYEVRIQREYDPLAKSLSRQVWD